MDLYTPVWGAECKKCEHTPVVGILAKSGTHTTGLCGVCFFQDRSMIDEELWNDSKESTE